MYFYRMNPKLKKPLSEQVMTVVLNLNDSNPNTWATYAEDAIGMTVGSDAWDEFFGHYPCLLSNGTEKGKLKRDDFTKYENGTSAPITTLGYDTMICFPRRGIKIVNNNNTITVSMTMKNNMSGFSYYAHTYKGTAISKFYMGAYKGYVSSNILYSVSGVTPTGNISISNLRTYAHNKGTGYEQHAYLQHIYLQVMYLLKYKGKNAQDVIGRGWTGNSNIPSTGGTNTKGMDYGSSNAAEQMKLFGMEDFYGSKYELLDGAYADTNRKIWVSDGNYNNTGSGFMDAGTTALSANISQGYMRYPWGNNLAGFAIASSTFGSATTYFCDQASVKATRFFFCGGMQTDGDKAGVFFLGSEPQATATASYYGSRLMYLPSS